MRVRAILALVAALAGMILGAPSAGAKAVAAASDPVYPPTTCAQLATSTTHPQPGATITVTGTSFDADATIRLYIEKPRTFLRSVKSDADGSFSTTVTLPDGLTGNRVITAIGGQVNVCPIDPVQISIQGGAAASAGGGGSTNGGGGTAFTGVDIAALLAAAAGLIGVGVLMNRKGRTAKRSTTHA